MRQILAVLLTLVLSGPFVMPSELPPDPRTQIRSLPMGAPLEVKLKTGHRVRGRLVAVDSERLTIAVGRGKNKTARVIRLSEAESVKAQQPTHTPVVAWIAVGALVAVVVVVVAAVLIERRNEGG